MNWADDEKIEMTAAERDMIARFTAAKCRPHGEVMAEKLDRFVQSRQLAAVSTANDYALAAASQTRHVPSGTPVAPSEDVMFVFASEAEEAGKAWRAELTVPANATVGTLLNLKVSGLGVDAVPQGVFFLAGGSHGDLLASHTTGCAGGAVHASGAVLHGSAVPQKKGAAPCHRSQPGLRFHASAAVRSHLRWMAIGRHAGTACAPNFKPNWPLERFASAQAAIIFAVTCHAMHCVRLYQVLYKTCQISPHKQTLARIIAHWFARSICASSLQRLYDDDFHSPARPDRFDRRRPAVHQLLPHPGFHSASGARLRA